MHLQDITSAAGRIWRDDRGQDLAEYGIALAVVGIAVAFTARFIGMVIESDLWDPAYQVLVNAVGGS